MQTVNKQTGKRVFLVGTSMGPDCMEKHVFETLRCMGHTPHFFNMNLSLLFSANVDLWINQFKKLVSREPERLKERLMIREIIKFQPDLILVLLGNYVSPKTIIKIRKTFSGKLVCWCQDQLTTIGRQYIMGSDYDAVFFKDKYLVSLFRRMLGVNQTHYLPEACNPVYHKKEEIFEGFDYYKSDIFIYGELYYYRQAMLKNLTEYNLKIAGHVPDWLDLSISKKSLIGPVYEREKCRFIEGAGIVLNTLHYAEIEGVNCRAFEVAGAGGFQIMSHTDAVHDLFEVDKEVVTFDSLTELLDKVEYYLKRPEKCNEIGRKAQDRAYAQHTYAHRLEYLMTQVFGYS